MKTFGFFSALMEEGCGFVVESGTIKSRNSDYEMLDSSATDEDGDLEDDVIPKAQIVL